MAQQIGVHVQAVLYPDVARLFAAGAIQEFRRAILQVEVMLAAIGIAVVLTLLAPAQPILLFTAGTAFLGEAPLMIVAGIAVAVMPLSFPAAAALPARGHPRPGPTWDTVSPMF